MNKAKNTKINSDIFHHLKDNSYKEISDVLDEVLGFIQRYKLGTNFAEIYFKKEVYNISIFLREMKNVETIINNIIIICYQENAEIRYEVDNMFSFYHRIQRYVKEKARKVKEVSCI